MSVGENKKVISGNGTARLMLCSHSQLHQSEIDGTSELGDCPAKLQASHVILIQRFTYYI
jgi:hypothetical protein